MFRDCLFLVFGLKWRLEISLFCEFVVFIVFRDLEFFFDIIFFESSRVVYRVGYGSFCFWGVVVCCFFFIRVRRFYTILSFEGRVVIYVCYIWYVVRSVTRGSYVFIFKKFFEVVR